MNADATAATSDAGSPHVGRALRRKEDPRLITGRARYIDDISLPGMVWAALVRSPEAHAKIGSIDASAARERPDVHAVFTGQDMTDLQAPLPLAWAPPGVEINDPTTGRWRVLRSSTWATRSPSCSARTATRSWTPPRMSPSSTTRSRS